MTICGHEQPWNIPTSMTTHEGAQVSSCPKRQAKKHVGFSKTEALTQQREQAHIRPHPVGKVLQGLQSLQDCQSCWSSLAIHTLRRNRARRYGCSTSTSQAPVLPALVLPHQAEQPKCKMKSFRRSYCYFAVLPLKPSVWTLSKVLLLPTPAKVDPRILTVQRLKRSQSCSSSWT